MIDDMKVKFLIHGKDCGLLTLETSCSIIDMVSIQKALDRMMGIKRTARELRAAAVEAQRSRMARSARDFPV